MSGYKEPCLLNLPELLDGELTKIRNVIRFSNSTRIKDESVAEHSYFTAYYALVLAASLVTVEKVEINMSKILASAILHDIDEAKSGDFVRHFKYSDPELKAHIEAATDNLMQGCMYSLFSDTRKGEASVPAGYLHRCWKEAKQDDTIEGDIVAFADFLSVLSYVMNEIDCGNTKLVRQLDDMHEYVESFYARKIFKEYKEPINWLFQVMSLLNKYHLKED